MFYCRPGGKNKDPDSELSVYGFKQYTSGSERLCGAQSVKMFKFDGNRLLVVNQTKRH